MILYFARLSWNIKDTLYTMGLSQKRFLTIMFLSLQKLSNFFHLHQPSETIIYGKYFGPCVYMLTLFAIY